MKNIYFTALVLSFLCLNTIHSQVTPNSNRFDVENFIAIDNKGKYYPYTTHGFYENVAKGTAARIFILPVLKLDLNKIKFIDKQGRETYQGDENIRSMIIPVTQDLALPNETQKAGIIAAIKKNTSIQAYAPDMVRNVVTGVPYITPLLLPGTPLHNQIIATATKYQSDVLNPQQQLISDYNANYKAQIISPTELEIIVEAGGEVVYTKRIPNTWIATGKYLKINNNTFLKSVYFHFQ